MADYAKQRFFDDVKEGEEIPTVQFPLSLHRMIVQAGANYDYAPIHVNTEVAQAQGASEMYINNVFIQAMWERAIREYIGLDGVIKKVGPFRIKTFGIVGENIAVKGHVTRKWQEGGNNFVELELRSELSDGRVSTGPGPVVVSLPA